MYGELIYTIYGQEFRPWKVKVLILIQALYELKSTDESKIFIHKYYKFILYIWKSNLTSL